ncbi:hypothetical protein [Ideonella sp.]|uniref:hypothetical protein n=1 Tax=Ideonella sp. TaxID=1929293 RepID=UPI002B483D45|nr:hypothetical protein [Ideonella sp.]HJV72487.1 hypothetical protein [Ideonella sp.]
MELVSWHALLSAARAFVAVAVAAAGLSACDGPTHPPPRMELTVTSTDAPAAVRGEDSHFLITVTNPSSHEVRDVELLEFTDYAKTGFRSATCSARGGATCPDLTPGPWTTPVMPAGSSLTFDVAVAVYFTVTSTFENVFIVQSSRRLDSVSATGHGAVVADARSGTYRIYGSGGGLSNATLEMMGNTLTLDDGETSPIHKLDDGSYLSSNGVRFGTGLDVLIGQIDADGGPEPFIAARRFVTAAAELDGLSFNMFASDFAGGGARQTRAFAAWFEGNTLTTCTDSLLSAENCPAASLRHYDLTVVDGIFTGVDAIHGDSQKFQVAKSGSSLVFLRADTGPDFHGLQVGIAVQGWAEELVAFGTNTRGDWGWVRIWATNYLANWTTASSATVDESASMSPVPGANSGLSQGQRSSDGATIYAAFDTALAVVIADGELQLFSELPPLP